MNFERTECQYCGDAGLCEFCERGKIAVFEYLKKQKKDKEPEIETVQDEPLKSVPVGDSDDNWSSPGYNK